MIKTIAEFIEWLDGFMNFEQLPRRDMLKLNTMRELSAQLGHPERSYRVVHVAGSKGKGSTCRMIAEMLAGETSKAVGIFASPHLLDFRERISSTAGFFDEEIYLKAANMLVEAVQQSQEDNLEWTKNLTWFELVTMFGFLCFREASCDWAVIEVGMGGRLDATNIVEPALCVITALELEHCKYLGNTLEEIAKEKCGIIKSGAPVVIAPQSSAKLTKMIMELAKEHGSTEIHIAEMADDDIKVGMRGRVQRENAGTAMKAGEVLMLNREAILTGIARAKLPGRFEEFTLGEAVIILDAAHTVNSVRATLETWEDLTISENNRLPRYLLVGLAADKNAEEIAAELAKAKFDRIFVTRPGDFKKSDLPRLVAAFANQQIDITAEADFAKFIPEVLAQTKRDRAQLLVTGSFYLLAEVGKILQNL